MEKYNFEQARKNWESKPVYRENADGTGYCDHAQRPVQPQFDDSLKLKAQITAQRDALGANINLLEAVIDCLTQRLQPVLLDCPSTCRSEDLERTSMSPIAASFYEANQRVLRAADNLQDLIERLEV
jgi:hypothetical protein